MNYILMGIGAWLVIDGAYSFWEYRTQQWYAQLIRVIRIALGISIFEIGGLL